MLELAHFNRFSTAGELASSIAHEINQPLGAILTNTETARLMVKSQSPDLDETEKILADIERDNRRASEVIRRLRSYVTKVPFEIKEFDLNGQVAETLDFLSPQARSRNIVLRSELTGTPLQIKGDSIQLQQVLSNLILNAMDAVSESASARREVIVTTAEGEIREGLGCGYGAGNTPGSHEDDIRAVLFHQEARHGHGSFDRAHDRCGA
jgi:C4-dicarboxylate-specific signal transduction histidine kinase